MVVQVYPPLPLLPSMTYGLHGPENKRELWELWRQEKGEVLVKTWTVKLLFFFFSVLRIF